MKKEVCVYAILAVLIAFMLRLYPYLISSLPFSTDAWAPVRNTELLMERTPIPLDDKIFDGYHNYWPANSLFGAVISETTSLRPLEAMAIFLPLTGAATILIFYVIVNKLYNAKISFIASIIFGTAFTHAFFTAGVTKETYANPIYLLLILIFLHPTIGAKKQVLLFTLTSLTLALAHHFTALNAILIVSSIVLAHFISNVKEGLAFNKSDFLLVLIVMTAPALYYGLYAHAAMEMPLTFSDWLSVTSYQIIMFTLAMYLTGKPSLHTQTRTLIAFLGTMVLAVLFILLTINITLVPSFTPTLQKHVLVYISPYFIILPFITLGYGYQRQIRGPIAPLFWLATLMGLEAYAVFSNSSQSIGLWIRTPNFLYPPLAILSATGLFWIYGTRNKPHLQKLIKSSVIATLLLIVSINVYSLYAAVSLQDRYMGYHWLYRVQEYKAGVWIATTNSNITVAGDMKIAYLMRDYFRVNVDVLQGFRYLVGESQSQPQILFVYDQMMKNGYVLGLHGMDLPENWVEKTSLLNLVYSNGLASLYAE